MKLIRVFWRLFLLAVFTTWKTGQALLPMLTRGYDLAHALRTRREWAEKICRYVGIRVNYIGQIPDYPCLLLANHRSYLDPILILGATEAFPVAKAEVRKWPVLGAGAAATGVIFLNRASAKSRGETLFAIAEQFEKGHRVILFPEGTTSGGQTTIPFKKGSFQLAAKYNLPIVPVAIKYSDKRDFWIGDESFVGHFFRTFGEKRKLVDVVFGEKIAGGNADFLMNETRNWLDGELLN
jgi:lyso-ornithine lipid O-acyltransferase